MPQNLNIRRLLVLAVLLLVCGCGSGGPTRYKVSGTVTYEGENVPTGTITFKPAGDAGGAIGVADISDGKFETQPGKGVPAGQYVALVYGHDKPGAEPDVEEGLPPTTMGPPLFDEISIPVELPAGDSTHTFELP